MKKILLVGIILFCVATSHAQDTWTQKASVGGGGRTESVGFSIGNKGYLGTGSIPGVGNANDFWEYDPANDSWTQKANFGGSGRINAVGFSIGNKGYIGTGNDGNSKADFWEYDPTSDIWTKKADLGGTAREAATGFAIGGKGYIGTGRSNGGPLKDFWEYDPGTNTWTRKADFGGVARYGASGFNIGDKGYIGIGGSTSRPTDFWQYNPATDNWTQKANFGGIGRFYAADFSIGNKGYIGTGYIGFPYLNDFWEYDPISNDWTQKANFAGVGRRDASGFSIGVKGYIGSGSAADVYADFWEYSPEFDIVTNALTGSPYCAGSLINISFTSSGTFNAGNVFTAQLSDANGSFTSPLNIGTLNSSTSGTINATIPSNTPFGNAYRIRVVSNNPAVIGIDNGTDLTIHAPTSFYRDADEDGYGNPGISTQACTAPSGYVSNNTDCYDGNSAVNPGALEVCDGLDNNCNGQADEGFVDTDGDAYANCVDTDDDNDGIPDINDNCPLSINANQADRDRDGIGDLCDDSDNDGVSDAIDNCPSTYNPNQADEDHDGQGDVCDLSCGNKNDKARICHNGNELCVSPNAVKAHLAHGDKLGPCSIEVRTQSAPSSTLQEATISVVKTGVSPNPNDGQFTVQLSNFKTTKAEVLILDFKGSIIESRQVQLTGKGQTLHFNIRNKPGGMYVVKVVSTEGVQTTKVVVQK